MLIISLYLVIAPIVDNPQIEYLYSILFMAVGAVLYVPFVYMGYVFKFMDKVTTFLQVWKKQNNLYFLKLHFPLQLMLQIAPPCGISDYD